MTLVYRVEHKHHRYGPYTGHAPGRYPGGWYVDAWAGHSHAFDKDRLPPDPWPPENYRFALAELRHVEDWFSRYAHKLHAIGFHVAVVEVKEDALWRARADPRQVAFHYRRGRRQRFIDLRSL